MRRRTWWLAAAMLGLAVLAACGGGGSDAEASDGNLYVNFEYPQQVQTFAQFDSVSITPVVEGLGNGQAHFRVRDGSGATLPEGMTLNERTGAISGYAGQAGSAYVWVDMTVDGYEEWVSSLLSVNVTSNITLRYPLGPVYGRVNSAIAAQQPTITGLQTGDSVTNFRLQSPPGARIGELPPGVTLDAQTGAVSGTPTAAGTYSAFIAATVMRGSMQATIQAPSYIYFNISN